MTRTVRFLALSLALGSVPAGLVAQAGTDSAQVDLIWGVRIPMRDKVSLSATVYKPKGVTIPLPVIFTLTPYTADSYHERALYFAKHGYVFVLVDVRGRGSSGGTFEPALQEARDGHDIVEWLAQQPWSNGRIGMWGGSYAGYDQWATLKEFPPHLQTIVPAAAAFLGVDFPIWKNISLPYLIQWLTMTSGVTANGNLFGESGFWIAKFRELYLNHLPFRSLDSIVGNLTTRFQTWVSHPMQDSYWDAMTPSDSQFARVDIPILTITGHYDADQPGALEYYKRQMRAAPPAAREQHYLIIGPWDHPGTRTPKLEFGGLTVGKASMLDLNALHKEWYDWTLKRGRKPEFLKKRVAYYVPGSEEWKYADSLEGIATERRVLYLSSETGHANDPFHSGTLSARPPTSSEADHYVYDPLDTRPAELEQEELKNNITDQRYALNLFGNGVIYHTEPFRESTEVTGYLKFVVWMSLDVPDTDFGVSLYEILPDGSSILLTQDQLRARFRESLRNERLVKLGEILRYDFSGFTYFSRRIAKGSRLRLVLASPNSIYAQKNYNSGKVVAEESGNDARTSHVTIYHDSRRPSHLELPIVKSESKEHSAEPVQIRQP